MQRRRLGAHGAEVSAIGLGCMGMSGLYGPADDDRSIATIRHAVERGVTLLDTGDFYGMGHNEALLGRALKELPRDQLVISVKFGALRDPGGGWNGVDARPAAVKNFLAYTLTRLGVDYIDIYRPARLDPDVPIEDTVGAIAELIEAGHVRWLGLSEVSAGTIRRAHAVHPVADLQIEYSVMSRGVERSILPTLRELDIGMTAYGVFSRGLIAEETDATGGIRSRLPRFAQSNYEANRGLVAELAAVARELGINVSQLALAWVAAQDDRIVPLVGTRSASHLDEAVAALDVSLSESDLRRIADAIRPEAVRGTRYDLHQMEALDSERD